MTIPSEVIEKVARAIYEVSPEWDSGETIDGFQVTPAGPIKWDSIVECERHSDWYAAALAALTSSGWGEMREALEKIAALNDPSDTKIEDDCDRAVALARSALEKSK